MSENSWNKQEEDWGLMSIGSGSGDIANGWGCGSEHKGI